MSAGVPGQGRGYTVKGGGGGSAPPAGDPAAAQLQGLMPGVADGHAAVAGAGNEQIVVDFAHAEALHHLGVPWGGACAPIEAGRARARGTCVSTRRADALWKLNKAVIGEMCRACWQPVAGGVRCCWKGDGPYSRSIERFSKSVVKVVVHQPINAERKRIY